MIIIKQLSLQMEHLMEQPVVQRYVPDIKSDDRKGLKCY